ncbi:MAG: sigma-70 family RNA polymerase sigma factor [Clostridia bacterium]|nr:sigma-70 family RNA polymerase sigma factor [Clostridia bacterium]
MDRTQAERLIAEHVKPIFGFALKRCARIQDAEDVAQEIALKAYCAFTARDDVTDPVRYLWTIAHHTVANHYRDRRWTFIGQGPDTAAETDPLSVLLDKEATERLRKEIACLSRTQREIIAAYYFHGKKQSEIAAAMQLPLGTVKWHLFEAKKELKRSMETTRNLLHLSFDPIHFTNFSISGSSALRAVRGVFSAAHWCKISPMPAGKRPAA